MGKHRLMFVVAGLALAVLVVAAAAGCGGTGDTAGSETATETASDTTSESKTLKVGEEFEVELESNPTTGYQWSMTTRPDEAVLGLTRDEYVGPESSDVGAPGVRIWKFKALAAGKTSVVFEYVRSWEKDEPPARTHSVSVEVR